MKKRILTLVLLLLSSLSLFSSPSIYMRSGYSLSFDTNIFSYPLPKRTTGGADADNAYLKYKIENPYIYRIDNELKFAAEIYFGAQGRTGLSFSGELGFPFSAVTYTPSSSDSNSEWNYIKADATGHQAKKLSFGIGPSFRAILGMVDLGCNIRLTVGSYTHFDDEAILGLNVEGFANYFIGETFFFFTNVGLDAQFLNFYLDRGSSNILRPHYIMACTSASIGLGLKFGPRG